MDYFNRHCTVCGSLFCRADEDAIKICEIKKNCEYKLEVPDKFTLCGYYHKNIKINDRIYAHFPKCGDEPCPLLYMDD